MKPSELWYQIGSIIADECNCTAMWDVLDKEATFCPDVTVEQRKKIAGRAILELLLSQTSPQLVKQ